MTSAPLQIAASPLQPPLCLLGIISRPFPKDTHPSTLPERFLFRRSPYPSPLLRPRRPLPQQHPCLPLGLTAVRRPAFPYPLRFPTTPSDVSPTRHQKRLPLQARRLVAMPPWPPVSIPMTPSTSLPLLQILHRRHQKMNLHYHNPSRTNILPCVASWPSPLQLPSPILLHTRPPNHLQYSLSIPRMTALSIPHVHALLMSLSSLLHPHPPIVGSKSKQQPASIVCTSGYPASVEKALPLLPRGGGFCMLSPISGAREVVSSPCLHTNFIFSYNIL